MTLRMLDRTYSDGLADQQVDNNIRGIYSLTKPTAPINDSYLFYFEKFM